MASLMVMLYYIQELCGVSVMCILCRVDIVMILNQTYDGLSKLRRYILITVAIKYHRIRLMDVL